MTWAALAASGRGQVAYALEIPGVGVFTSIASWTAVAAYGAARHYPYLIQDSLPAIREQVDPLEGALDVEDISVELADVGGAVTALVRDWRASGYAYLASTLTAAATTVALDDASWASADGGTAWCEREALTYAGISGTSLTSASRAALGTTAVDHLVDWTADPPVRPLVTSAPHTLIGRRCLLHAAELEAGVPGTTTVVYRGRITGHRTGHGLWRLEIAHISDALLEEVGGALPSAPLLAGYWLAGLAPRSLPQVTVVLSGVVHEVVTTLISSGYRYSASALAAAWSTAVAADGLSLSPRCYQEDDRYIITCDAVGAERHLVIVVREGDPLWALGFDPGTYTGEENTAFEMTAQGPPRALVIDFSTGADSYPEVRLAGSDVLTHSCYVIAPGQPYARVVSTASLDLGGGATATRALLARDLDIDSDDDKIPPNCWAIEDEKDLEIQHAIVLGTRRDPCTLAGALDVLLGLGIGSEPDAWVSQTVASADVAGAELTTALASAPPALASVRRLVISKPTKIWDVIGPHLGLLGIFPRITVNGMIGFARLGTPVPSMIDPVALDSSIWALDHAVDVEARVDHASMVNCVTVEHSYDYRTESFADGRVRIVWDDGLNSLGSTREITYPCRGICLKAWGTEMSATDLAEMVRSQITATHFGGFGRATTILEIPCTWTARQLVAGDYVAVTHDLAPDAAEGALGVTARYGLVIGTSRSLTGLEPDSLLVQLYPSGNPAGIAPAAYCASWAAVPMRLAVSGSQRYGQDGTYDLDWLSAGHLPAAVSALSRGTSTAALWAATVTAVSGVYLFLATDPFSSAFPAGGVWLSLPDWDLASTWQRTYAYHASGAAVPVLGSSADEAKEWSI